MKPKTYPIITKCKVDQGIKDIFLNSTISFKDGKCYVNDDYFGDVIYSDSDIIQVECKNDNRLIQGYILTLKNKQ